MNHIEPTEELLTELWAAQLRHTRGLIDSALHYGGTGDDGHDYLTAALELSDVMQNLRYDGDLHRLGALLNTPSIIAIEDDLQRYSADEKFLREHGFPHLSMIACDGIAPEFYALNCPALKEEE